jgi:hypothetical protein
MKILQKILTLFSPPGEGLPEDVAHLKMPRPLLVCYSILDTGRRKKESEEFYWYAIENMVRIKHPEEPNLHRES